MATSHLEAAPRPLSTPARCAALSSGGVLSVGGTLSHAGMVTEAAGTKITVGKGGDFEITRRAQLSGTTAGAGILILTDAVATTGDGAKVTVARMDLSDGAAVTVKTDLTYAGTLFVVAGTKLTVGTTDTLRLTGTDGGSGASISAHKRRSYTKAL